MKRFLTNVICIVVLLCLSACGSRTKNQSGTIFQEPVDASEQTKNEDMSNADILDKEFVDSEANTASGEESEMKLFINDVEVPVAPTTIGVERSFVWINSDSLATCIVKTYTSDVKVSKGRKEFTVEYPSNKLILMHNVSEGAKADLDSLKLYAKDHFKCKEDNNSVKITLTVEDGFVCCPTALLLPLLDDNKNN